MEAMKPKTVFLCLVVMGCVPSVGYAQSLQEAIDEALIVPIATLEVEANYLAAEEIRKTARDNINEMRKAALGNTFQMCKALWDKYDPDSETTINEYKACRAKQSALETEILKKVEKQEEKEMKKVEKEILNSANNRTTAIGNAKAKAQQGKQRARHCRSILKPVDDHLEIGKLIECVQTMEAISDACTTATDQFRQDKKLKVGIDTEMDTLKGYVTQCVTKNIAGFSALMVYEVGRATKDRYAGVIGKCKIEVLPDAWKYESIWSCFKRYLDMIDEPLPDGISP